MRVVSDQVAKTLLQTLIRWPRQILVDWNRYGSENQARPRTRVEFAMKIVRAKTFTADRAWGAVDIAAMNGITVRLHWTDQPYRWHVNDGEEVFTVLDGTVDMHYRDDGAEQVAVLEAGDVFFAGIGCEHVAHPRGEARILVVEREGSV
jgi:mannose-6-phosphate isomerase-like protein (cupin superfamily)